MAPDVLNDLERQESNADKPRSSRTIPQNITSRPSSHHQEHESVQKVVTPPSPYHSKEALPEPPLVSALGALTDLDKQKIDDDTPDGGYGWVVIGCQVGINAVTWGT